MIKLLSKIKLFKTSDGYRYFQLGYGKRHKNYEIFWISKNLNVNDKILLPLTCKVVKTKKGNYVISGGSDSLVILISSKKIKIVDDVSFIKKLKSTFYIYVISAVKDFTLLYCGKKYKVDLKQNILIEYDKDQN